MDNDTNNTENHSIRELHPAVLPTKIVLFDGVCNLCSGAVQFIIRHDRNATFKFATLQSATAEQLLAGTPQQKRSDVLFKSRAHITDSIYLIENGRLFAESSAVIRIAKHLDGGWKLLAAGWILPKSMRDALYRIVARHRYVWFGKKNNCLIPAPEIRERFIDDSFL